MGGGQFLVQYLMRVSTHDTAAWHYRVEACWPVSHKFICDDGSNVYVMFNFARR